MKIGKFIEVNNRLDVNNMPIKTEGHASDSLSGQIGLIINGYTF
jgi:hypothetical protein